MNQWDKLSEYFDTRKHGSDIDPGAADNILIAWPSVLRGISMAQENGTGLSALDYGCGGGSFAEELQRRGYSVVGCDSSPAMIAVARKNFGDKIAFYTCDSDEVPKLEEAPFDLITGIMVFQFVEDIEACFSNLDSVLKPGGVLSFAVFNPDFVLPNHGPGKFFQKFKTPEQPTKGFLTLSGDATMPVFIRTEEEYDNIIASLGYQRIYTDRPPFTGSFLEKYPFEGVDTTVPEYLVMTYKKS